MNLIIRKLLKFWGWKRLLSAAWGAVREDLIAYAEKTPNKVDDNLIRFIDEMIQDVVSGKIDQVEN